ncbi:uncharacterized protein [Maniola hyperantus]|uniref:uncharacterized protein n=1 Tax=Aphantopus hyperantus TaxID=2795564 RepID=UPI001569D501|nr:uncharacterized protein LOC117989361 [Maniola hyperantus]
MDGNTGNSDVKKEDLTELAAISLKSRIPVFWRHRPRLWFAQFECIVASQKLSDEAKFQFAIGQLELCDIEQIGDIVLEPPATAKYETLKSRLIDLYEESNTKRLHKVIHDMELGSQKPSQLLRRMRDVAQKLFPEDTLKLLWISHLPQAVRTPLSMSTETSLDKLATTADKMIEQQNSEVNSVCQSSTSTQGNSDSIVLNKIEELSKEIAAIKLNQSQFSRRPRRVNIYRPPVSQEQKFNHSRICFYHRRFGDQAYRCLSPCEYKKQVNNQSTGN